MIPVKGLLKRYEEIDEPAKAAVWYLICKFFQSGMSVLTVPLFTRLLTASEYGEVSVFSSWIEIFTIFLTLNLSYGIFNKGLLIYKDDRDEYVSQMQGLSLAIGGVMLIVLSIIYFCGFSSVVKAPFSVFFMMEVYCILSSALNFWSARQRFEYKYKKYAFVTILMFIVTPVLSLVVVYNSEQRVMARIVSSLIFPIGIYLFFCIYNFAKGRSFYNRKVWIDSLRFNIPLIPHYLSQIILASSDRIMIDYLMGNAAAGLYSIANSVASVVTLINTSITSSLNPWIFQNLDTKNYEGIKKGTEKILLFVSGCVLLIIICAPELLSIFASKEYFSARWAIPPIILGIFYSFISGYFGNIEFFFMKNKVVLFASCCSAVVNIILNYIFIRYFGYIACAYTTMFCYFLFCIVHYYYLKKLCRDELGGIQLFNIKWIFLIAFIVTVVGLSEMLLYDYLIVRIALAVIFGFLFVTVIRKGNYGIHN